MEDELGTHYFAVIKKQFQFCVCRFTVPATQHDFDPSTDNLVITVMPSAFVRPFRHPISMIKWLNHALTLVTLSLKDEIRTWDVSHQSLAFSMIHEESLFVSDVKGGEQLSMLSESLSLSISSFTSLTFPLFALFCFLALTL